MISGSATVKALVFLCLIAIIMLYRYRWAVYILLTTIFYADWLSVKWLILPKEISWQIEVAVIVLLLILFAKTALKSRRIIRTPLDKYFAVLIVIGALSCLHNSTSPIVAVLGMRTAFKYPLLFYILVQLQLEEKFYKNLIIYFIVLLLIQIPVSVMQFFLYNPEILRNPLLGKAGISHFDFITGTLGLGQSGTLGLMMICTISVLLGFYFSCRRNIYLILALLALIPIVLGESRASILYLPLALLFLFKEDLFKKFLINKIIILVAILGFVLFLIFFAGPRKEKGLAVYNIKKLYNQHTRDRTEEQLPQGRLANIKLANDILSENAMNRFIGYGPGSASPSVFKNHEGDIYHRYSWASINNQQIGWFMLEFGYLGLFFFFMIILRIYRMNKMFICKIQNKFWGAVSLGFMGIIFVFSAGAFYNPVWYKDLTAFCFWFFTAVIFSTGRKREIFS